MRLNTTLSDAARRNAASRPAMPHHRIPMRRDPGVRTETPASHSVVSDVEMIAM